MANDPKGDGAGLSLKDLSELSDSFKTISEIFAKMAREQKATEQKATEQKAKEHKSGSPGELVTAGHD
jgi:hypothetical protein